jgi:hypothetical protein
MKKLNLDLSALCVESFVTVPLDDRKGTVAAHFDDDSEIVPISEFVPITEVEPVTEAGTPGNTWADATAGCCRPTRYHTCNMTICLHTCAASCPFTCESCFPLC